MQGLHLLHLTNKNILLEPAQRSILTLLRLVLIYGYTAIKHHVPDRVKPSFVIFDIGSLWRSGLSVRVTGCQKLQMTA